MEAKKEEEDKSKPNSGDQVVVIPNVKAVNDNKNLGPHLIKQKAKVWQYFDYDEKSNECACKIPKCGEKIKYNHNTSAMLSHIKSFHKTEYSNLTENVETQIKITSPQFKIGKLSKEKQEQITKALAKFIAKELKPFQMIYTNSFSDFIKILEPRYEIPARQTFMEKVIPEIYNTNRKKLMDQLYNVYALGCTFDLWSSLGTKSFITITVHFVNSIFESKSYVLKTIEFSEIHSGKNIAKNVVNAFLEFYGNDFNKVLEIYAVTDGAKNMISAGECLKWTRSQCFAHVLHNSLKDGMNNTKISELISKVHNLITNIRASPKIMMKFIEIRKSLNLTGTKLKIDNETRWNSIYIMIKSILHNKGGVIALHHTKSLDEKNHQVAIFLFSKATSSDF